MKPAPAHICPTEGDEWIPWEFWNKRQGRDAMRAHAIRFADGSIWDCVNGWRDDPTEEPDAADRQEALSKKYVAPHILQLSSGLYALFGADRQLIAIDTWDRIQYQVNTYRPPAEVKRTAPAKKFTVTLTLEDLDL